MISWKNTNASYSGFWVDAGHPKQTLTRRPQLRSQADALQRTDDITRRSLRQLVEKN